MNLLCRRQAPTDPAHHVVRWQVSDRITDSQPEASLGRRSFRRCDIAGRPEQLVFSLQIIFLPLLRCAPITCRMIFVICPANRVFFSQPSSLTLSHSVSLSLDPTLRKFERTNRFAQLSKHEIFKNKPLSLFEAVLLLCLQLIIIK